MDPFSLAMLVGMGTVALSAASNEDNPHTVEPPRPPSIIPDRLPSLDLDESLWQIMEMPPRKIVLMNLDSISWPSTREEMSEKLVFREDDKDTRLPFIKSLWDMMLLAWLGRHPTLRISGSSNTHARGLSEENVYINVSMEVTVGRIEYTVEVLGDDIEEIGKSYGQLYGDGDLEDELISECVERKLGYEYGDQIIFGEASGELVPWGDEDDTFSVQMESISRELDELDNEVREQVWKVGSFIRKTVRSCREEAEDALQEIYEEDREEEDDDDWTDEE